MPGTGNRTVIIGGNKLHCDPPAPPPEYGPSYERGTFHSAANHESGPTT